MQIVGDNLHERSKLKGDNLHEVSKAYCHGKIFQNVAC